MTNSISRQGRRILPTYTWNISNNWGNVTKFCDFFQTFIWKTFSGVVASSSGDTVLQPGQRKEGVYCNNFGRQMFRTGINILRFSWPQLGFLIAAASMLLDHISVLLLVLVLINYFSVNFDGLLTFGNSRNPKWRIKYGSRLEIMTKFARHMTSPLPFVDSRKYLKTNYPSSKYYSCDTL